MNWIKCWSTLSLFLLTLVCCFAQTHEENLSGPIAQPNHSTEIDSFLVKLPSLNALIDSALVNDPQLKIQTVEEKLRMHEMDVARKSWSKNIITGSANYNYGDNLILGESVSTGQINTSNAATSHYSVGVSMRIPITSLFDHQDLDKARIEMEKAKAQRLVIVRDVREDVNARYLNLLNAYNRYKILLDDLESHEVVFLNAQKDFLAGRISLQEVTAFQTTNTKARLDVAQAQSEFNSAVWRLEEIVGFRLSY